MKFGPVPPGRAAGAILAHSLIAGGRRFRKGEVLSEEAAAALAAAGIEAVTVARLGPGDLGEDDAAARIAAALAPGSGAGLRLSRPFTGRVNLYATRPGVLRVDAEAIRRVNALDPALTVATLPPLARVLPGQMAATVKIITYGVPETAVVAAETAALGSLGVLPVVLKDAALILTEVPGQKRQLRDKGRRAVAGRLKALGIELAESRVAPHATEPLAEAIAGVEGALILLLTGSATSDSRDVGPEALRAAGGQVTRFGMPVDPGNLLFLGALQDRPVIGLPGCARSPALNGADWVLERIACGLTVGDAEITAMGVGGLLKESPARPAPRDRRGRGN